jgi:hypothetical protein
MYAYSSNARRPQTVPCDKDLFDTVIDAVKVSDICAEIKDAKEQVMRGEMSRADFETFKRDHKIALPAFLFQANFSDGKRHNASAISSGLSMFDIDHITAPEVYYKEHIESRIKELNIVLAHITPSTEGLRLVFVLQDGETPQEGQQRLAKALAIDKYDESVKDLARCSFAVPRGYILYIDYTGLFADHTPKSQKQSNNEHTTSPSANNSSVDSTVKTATEVSPVLTPDAKNLKLFDEVVDAADLSLDSLNEVGTRHNSLVAILSMGLCRLMPKEQLLAVVAVRMPEYAKERDCQDLIRDFYDKYTNPGRPMSTQLRRIYSSVIDTNKSKKDKQADNADVDDEITKKDKEKVEQQALINKIMHRLPIGLKESVEGVPAGMRMPVLCAVLPLAAAYADGVTVRYCDGAIHHLGLMSIIIGPQASGKSVCKAKVDIWQQQMYEEDARARELEDKWKEAKKCKKANEKAPEDPKVLIRSVPATISCSTLLRRLKYSRGHCLWTFCEELDTLRKTNGAGSWSSKYDIYRIAFDHGEWGQDYNSDQAESGVVNVAYNFSILGTQGALAKCFKSDNIENGLSSRMIIAEMPDSAFATLPEYDVPTVDPAIAINKAVTILRSQTGYIDTPRLRKAIREWVESKRIEAMAEGDLVKDTYRRRAAVIGFRCGVVARLLSGKENKTVIDFATLMAQYVLDEQMNVFGETLKQEYIKASNVQTRAGRNNNIFDMLPPVFTYQDLQQAKGPDTPRSTLWVIVSRWKSSGWICKISKNSWRKNEIDK